MTLIIIAIIGFTGQILASIIGATLNGRRSKSNHKLLESTHLIVNSQRTVMLRLIASMAKRIARDNPNDADAQLRAEEAMEEARRSGSY